VAGVSSTYLRHVRPADYSFLYGLLVDGGNGPRWRFGGATPSPEAFEHGLWAGVAAQFVAESPADGRLAHAALFNLTLEAAHAEASLAVVEAWQRRGTLAAGTGLALLHHAFTTWPLERILARVPAYNLPRLERLLVSGWRQEGRLTDHRYAFGRLWDEHILVLARADWEKLDARYGRFRLPLAAPAGEVMP
jgi:hypothetical protein